MKVVFLSTYPPAPCGIGDYTRELRQAVARSPGAADLDVEVVAERHPAVTAEVDAGVTRAWQRRDAWPAEAAHAVLPRRPAVVHIQHEEAILGQNGRLITFLRTLGQAGVARVVTLHSVYAGRLGLPVVWWPPPMFHRALAAHCEAIVVHQAEGGRDFLERQGVPPSLIHVIAHGTPAGAGTGTRDAARARLGLPVDGKIALYIGVIHRKKNLLTLAAAAPAIAAAIPGFRLVIAGNVRQRSALDARHGRQLARALAPGIAGGWIDFRTGYMAAGDIPAYLAAADLVLLPHDQSYGSASGIFHHALAAGRAVVCSSSPKFGEAREFFVRHIPETIAPAREPAAWARSVIALLGDDALRLRAEALARDAARATSWDVLGARYAALYREVAARPRIDAPVAATSLAAGA